MAWFEINSRGRNRLVFLIGRYAIKVPSPRCWRDFLFGLLNNMNEREFCKAEAAKPLCCPVLCSVPGGFAIVMPRVRTMTAEEFAAFDHVAFKGKPEIVRAEPKPDSFGWLDGRIVAVDYGW